MNKVFYLILATKEFCTDFMYKIFGTHCIKYLIKCNI